jgi:hypothetical protein
MSTSGVTVKRLAALCAVGLALGLLPVAAGVPASAATALVTAHPAFQASDGRDPVKITVAVATGASSTCTLTGDEGMIDEWTPCLPVYSFEVADLGDGEFLLKAVAQKNGVKETDVSKFLFDTVVPETVHTTRYDAVVPKHFHTSWYLKRREPLSFTFEVQQRLVSPFAGTRDWRTRAASTEKRSLEFSPEPGETICVRVRATDAVGHTGPWSREICRTRYVDDRKLEGWRGSPKWDAISFSGNYENTALVSKSRGARVWLPTERVGSLMLLGRTGPYGGRIEIRIGDKVIDRVDLTSRDPKRAVLFRDDFRDAKKGRLTIEVISPDGRYVHLDMLVVRR